MAFWGIAVKPGQPYIHRCDKRGRLHVSQATLGEGSSTKTMLQCEVGHKEPIYLCSLLPKVLEVFALNLEFEEDDDVTFSVVGSHSVHLSGFFNGDNEDKDDVEGGNIDAKCHDVEVTRENTELHGSSDQRDATITKNEVKRKKRNKKRAAAKKVSAQESGIPNTSGTEESLLAETGNDPKPSSERSVSLALPSGIPNTSGTEESLLAETGNDPKPSSERSVSLALPSGIPNTSGTKESLLAETGNDPKPSSEKLNLSVMEKGKSLLAGKGQPKHLVICFAPMSDPTFTRYSFMSFPVSKLIRTSLKEASCNEFTAVEKPEDEFVWCDQDDLPDHCKSRYYGMSFLHVGGGKVYAVGGTASDTLTLNRVFRCISLTTPLQNSTVKCMRSMAGVKYFPLIAEMGGLIYVLSGPPNWHSYHTNEIAFEVYDPSKNKWKVLPPPPFSNTNLGCGCYIISCFTHVVIDDKLCVSSQGCSCIFDPEKQKWEACNIFSEFKWKRLNMRPMNEFEVNELIESGLCGPPFPFWVRGIVYRDDILLCAEGTCVVAFKIEKLCGGMKAVRMQVRFHDNFPTYCYFTHLVDLGDGYAVGLAWDLDGVSWMSTVLAIIIFKVVLEITENGEGEVLTCELVNITRRNAVPVPEDGRLEPMCCFTM